MRLRAPLIALVALVTIAVLVTGGWAASRAQPDARTPLGSATELLAPNTRIASFTDWTKVREEIEPASFAEGANREAFMLRAHEQDLSYRSVLEDEAIDMRRVFGWSPLNIDWEIYGRANDGALLAARMGDNLSAATVEEHLQDAGYTEAAGLWSTTVDNFASRATGQPSTLRNIAILGGDRLILGSDRVGYLEDAVARHRGNARARRRALGPRSTRAARRGGFGRGAEVHRCLRDGEPVRSY